MLNLSYVGGGAFSNDGTASNGVIQGLNFSERLSYRRYVLSFFDQLQYAPQTAFGAAGIPNGPTLPGGGTLGFGERLYAGTIDFDCTRGSGSRILRLAKWMFF